MVKCAECGFLAVRIREDGSLIGANAVYRKEGFQGLRRDEVFAEPHCYVRAQPIHIEVLAAGGAVVQLTGEMPNVVHLVAPDGKDVTADAVLNNLTRERRCRSFVHWLGEGITPKEHWETVDRRWERKWRIIELIVLGVIAVLVAGGFTVLGAFIERGSIP